MTKENKFKIGDTINYYDSMDNWEGKVRGHGVVSNSDGISTHKVYLIEGKYAEDKEINWFEYSVEYADEHGELCFTTKTHVSRDMIVKTTLRKSEKYGCLYKVEDNTLYQSSQDSLLDWSEVSSFAFNEKERKEFDKYIQKLFGRVIELTN